MTIDILTRVQHPELYQRMMASAHATVNGAVYFISEQNDGLPKLAESYNRMVKDAKSDIVVLCHDDAAFMSDGWDDALDDAFRDPWVNVVGVVGSKNYKGGDVFFAGSKESVGAYVGRVNDVVAVKLFSGDEGVTPCDVVDSFFMAVRRKTLIDNPFDEQFDGLFFYDTDFMLRVKGVAVAPILMAHHKPQKYYGIYPKNMGLAVDYWDKFHKKHGLRPELPGDQRCAVIGLDDLEQMGRNKAYQGFVDRYVAKI